MAQWRVSSGTAAALGLCDLRMDVAPTTAYLLLGERCVNDCAFCTQARSSRASSGALSRVPWPQFPAEMVIEALACAYGDGRIVRACFQVTVGPSHLQQARDAVALLASSVGMPICASVVAYDLEGVRSLLEAGCERVTLALDAACEYIYRQVKGPGWERLLHLLMEAARAYPGRLGTHLIVGLGETEREMVERIQALHDLGVTIGLFAFTPVAGTRLADRQPPSLAQYRRVQVARWLIIHELARAEDYDYDAVGKIRGYGMDARALEGILRGGDAFRTSGCPGCNRPYYNERPGGVLYNYPRALSDAESRHEIESLLASLDRA